MTVLRDYFIGRQPIFDVRQQVIGYELLYRHRDGTWANVVDGDQATSQVIMHAFWELGLEKVVGGATAFINATRTFLLNADLLPPPDGRVVIEVLEDIMVDDEVTAAVQDLKARGYTVALDDFVYHPDLTPLIELADIIKLDVYGLSAEEIADQLDQLSGYRPKLLAEKVETPEMFDACTELKFDYFQGFFLCRPRVLSGKRLPASRINAMRMMTKLQKPELDIDALENLIAHDPTLSYRLLRYINSAALGLRGRIQSIRHAIVYLGEREIRRWATLLAYAGIDDKPDALIDTALTRARMCERIAALLRIDGSESAFMVGLFSTLDAMMDKPLADALADLPLSDEITDALLRGKGPLADPLQIALAYERGDWDALQRRPEIEPELSAIYLEAVDWSASAVRGVHGVA